MTQVENVVSIIMENEAVGGFLLPEIEKDVKKEEQNRKNKDKRRLVLNH